MTNIDNLTILQVLDLEREAANAGDEATLRDCRDIIDSYFGSSDASLPERIDNGRAFDRASAERIVKAINNAEAQVQ